MPLYRRRLPHWHPTGKSLFVTWHLHGSIPHNRFPPPGLSAGKAFVWMDRYMDEARVGPTWLKRPDVAQIVVDALKYSGEKLGYYDLHAYVVMANHVHILILPRVVPSKLMQSIKGHSAPEINKLLGRIGEPFWQGESYDHWVRDSKEFNRIRAYIENNPVRVGLARSSEDYRWSSAYAGMKAGVAG